MKLQNIILILGTIVMIILIILWIIAEQTSYQPRVALISAIITLLGYIFSRNSDSKKENLNQTTTGRQNKQNIKLSKETVEKVTANQKSRGSNNDQSIEL